MKLRRIHDPLPGTDSKGHTTTASADLPLVAKMGACGHFRMGPRYFVEREGLEDALLLLTLHGQGEIEASGPDGRCRTFPAVTRTAVLIDCRRAHRYSTAPGVDATWDFLWVHFHGEYIQPLVDRTSGRPFALSLSESLRMERRISEISDLAGQISPHADLRIAGHLYSLLTQLVETEWQEDAQEPERRYIESREGPQDVVDAAVRIIRRDFAQRMTVEGLAAQLHLSPSHLSRLFRRVHGVGPYRYLSTYRINQAKGLLAFEGRSVEEVAQTCGYGSTSNFIREFRRIAGETPLQYRKRSRV